MYEKLTNKSSKKELIKVDPNGYLYQVGHKIFLANKDTKRIDYYVQYELQHSFKFLTVTQIAIWMEYASKYADLPNGQRISKYVFFELLLPLADAIVTDSLQTIDGERFWINRIREAITSNMFVYAVYKDKNKIVRIETEEQLRKIKPNIWGDKKHHENRKIFISKTEIFPKAEKYKE